MKFAHLKFAQRGVYQVVAQRGGVKGGGHCARTKMQYNDVRISNEICAVGGGSEGGGIVQHARF